jgi:hypothetical protein
MNGLLAELRAGCEGIAPLRGRLEPVELSIS